MLLNEISCIVLIDEIEQHLHPSWQKAIVKLLRTQFPNIQFITTTHSPLVATGTTDLKDEECSLVLLDRVGHSSVTAHDQLQPPRQQRTDQILTSYLFGLTTTSDNTIVQKIQRYSQLASKVRNDIEEDELLSLHRELEGVLGTKETKLQHIVAKEVHKALQDKLESLLLDPKAVDFEIKRRLLELFNGE